MKGEKGKLVLVYILMLLVIGLIVFLTFMVLNDGKEEKMIQRLMLHQRSM